MQKGLKKFILNKKERQMRQLNIEEIKKYQLEMLNYIDSVCRKNDIEYSLAHGTLLGGIRHSGYIPWDDDVDIMLDPGNYERLLDVIKTDNKFDLLTPESKNYAFYYSKLIHPKTFTVCEDGYKHNDKVSGVFIDIFPLLPLNNPDKEIKLLKYYEKCKLVSLENGFFAFRKTCGTFKSIVRIPYVIFCKCVGRNYWSGKISTFIRKNSKNCKYYGMAPWAVRRSLDKELFKEMTEISFEQLELKVCKEYDKILTALYGDYMKLPPKSERHFPHSSEIMYKKED